MTDRAPVRKRWRTEQEADRFGFRWDQVDAIRYCEHRGAKCIGVETDRQVVQVWITPTGLIRCGKPTPQQRRRHD